MRREVRLGLDAGARMLSFGLVYLPGPCGDGELIAVAEEAAGGRAARPARSQRGSRPARGGRGDDRGRPPVGGALHLSHLKSLADERLIEPLLAPLDEAAAEIDLSFDQYPYGAGSTLLASILPAWAQEGGAMGTLRALGSRDERRRIARDIARGLPGWENLLGTLGPERIEIANAAPPNEDAVGRTLAGIAADPRQRSRSRQRST